MIILWVVTPLQSAVFRTSYSFKSYQCTAKLLASLETLTNHSSSLDESFLLNAYDSIWFNQSLPTFTALDGALLPFTLDASDVPPLQNATWNVPTILLSTSLNCTTAKVAKDSVGDMRFDSGDRCATTTSGLNWSEDRKDYFQGLYMGYYQDPNMDWSLSLLGCSANASNRFLAIWGQESDHTVTGMFCEPAYWKQAVNATVAAADLSVLSTTALAPKVPLTSNEFNATTLHYIFGTSLSPEATGAGGNDIINMKRIEQRSRLQNLNISLPTNTMVGYAMGLANLPTKAYLEPEILSSSFEKAH